MSSSSDADILFDGIDRKQLTRIKQLITQLNSKRYERALTVLSERQQHFLSILPLLFHVNHPMLPGYISHHTPAGVAHFDPSKEHIRNAKLVARSFTYQRDLQDKTDAIEALFFMGSLGTIAQADNSDIDVWVCYSAQTSLAALQELEQKCTALTRWAAEVAHIEAHFFLMNAQDFKQGKHSLLSGESSGTAQHFLLLDEFYRTAVWLAGKQPLWWYIPADNEKNYEDYAQQLLNKRFLKSDDFIDFGGVPKIPANEFLGAGVWQLYKGIESPHKSVLKLLLLEAYARDDSSEPLSLELKRRIYRTQTVANALDIDELDAYVLVYERLQDYLHKHHQPIRLELVRRCFYFKTGRQLSRTGRNTAKQWQRQLLENLVADWQWDTHQITMLDNRAFWKAPHVIAERNLLSNELNQGYRLLLDLNKNILSELAISSNELLILGRKLHAAFERKAGKMDWINPNISQDLSEPALCFMQAQDAGVTVWQVYRGTHQDFTLRNQVTEPIKRARHFMELLLWCYGNGIYVTGTKLDIVGQNFQLLPSQRNQCIQTLQQWLPLPVPAIAHEAFLQNAQPQRMLLLLNVGVEPQAELHKKGMQMLSSQRDALGYSGLKENLVITADIIQCNSWGEIVCRHFDADALVNSLLHYLRSIPPDKKAALPEFTVRCFSQGQGATIEQRVLDLWRAIINCFYSGTRPRNTRFIFEMAGEYLMLQFMWQQTQQHAQLSRFINYDRLMEKLALPQAEFSPLVIDDFALRDKPLRLFADIIRAPDIFMFYQVAGDVAQITVVDGKGVFFTKVIAIYNIQTLLRPLYRFIRAAVERQSLEGDIAPAAPSQTSIHIYEVMGDVKQKNAFLESRHIAQDISQLPFINVCAIAEPTELGELSFTLYCDGREFSALQFGEQLFHVVAEYILSCRTSKELYPCYITDLDLSLCRDLLAPQTGVQLIHYLQIKETIEQRLNAELKISTRQLGIAD